MDNDPRPAFDTATRWVAGLMANVTPTQLANPTPCTEFDVEALCSHLVGTVARAQAAAALGDARGVAMIGNPSDLAAYSAGVESARAAWADDASLGRPVAVPWGTVPGAGALWGYVNEQLVHGWDLAVATGQPAEADPQVSAAMLVIARQFIPPQREGTPFAEVVEPRPAAGATERLANWSGRDSTGWVAA